MLKKFFAVTLSGSLYEISDEPSENGWPTVKKISGPANPNMKIGTCLRNGKLIGISDLGICLFDPTRKYERRFEQMNISYWGGCTSAIAALFAEQTPADACITAGDYEEIFDKKYISETQEVLRKIGFDHPVFVIGDSVIKFM